MPRVSSQAASRGCLVLGAATETGTFGTRHSSLAASTSCFGTVSLCQVATKELQAPCTSHAGKAMCDRSSEAALSKALAWSEVVLDPQASPPPDGHDQMTPVSYRRSWRPQRQPGDQDLQRNDRCSQPLCSDRESAAVPIRFSSLRAHPHPPGTQVQ